MCEVYWFTVVHSHQRWMMQKPEYLFFHNPVEIRIVLENKIFIIISTYKLGFSCSSCLTSGPIVCFRFFQNYQEVFSRVYPALFSLLANDGPNRHDPTIMKVDLHILYPNPDKCISFYRAPSCFWKDKVLNQSSSFMYSCFLFHTLFFRNIPSYVVLLSKIISCVFGIS